MKEPISKLVKSPEWQKTRLKLLGNWKNNPDWCCRQLRLYLGSISTTSDDKLRIVLNYTTGTGFRIGMINPPCVVKLRSEISAEMKRRKYKN